MFYHTISITLVPGKRFPGVEHMKEFAAYMTEAYGVRTQVLGNETGKVYRHHFVTRYETMSQYEETMGRMLSDDKYQAWFTAGTEAGYYDWSTADTALFRVF